MKKSEIDKRYYLANREKCLKRVANYYQKNKDKISAYKKKWWREKNEKIEIPIKGEIIKDKKLGNKIKFYEEKS